MDTTFDKDRKERFLEDKILSIGKDIFVSSKRSIFEEGVGFEQLIEITNKNGDLKTNLFRFVDVLPVLKDSQQKKEHLQEYLGDYSKSGKPSWFQKIIYNMLDVPLLNRFITSVSDWQVKKMSDKFIVEENLDNAFVKLERMRDKNIGFTVDILGETVCSEEAAQEYFYKYKQLISSLGNAVKNWEFISQIDQTAMGPIPLANVSIKLSALDAHIDPIAYESSITRLIKRLDPLLQLAVEHQIFINFDMESYAYKDLTREVFKRILGKEPYRNYRFMGIVLQAYLKDSLSDAQDWVLFSQKRQTPFTIRLVKGAYWDHEVILAKQNSWEIPVYQKKSETDANYEDCIEVILNAYPSIELAVGSHNLRSIAYAMAYLEYLKLPQNAIEFQMLYGMASSFKRVLIEKGFRLRNYAPIGEMLPGLSYLVRRLLENSSNDSFLKQTFIEHKELKFLLKKSKRKRIRTHFLQNMEDEIRSKQKRNFQSKSRKNCGHPVKSNTCRTL